MVMHKKSKISFVSIILFMLYLTNCYENNKQEDLKDGKLFFIKNCSPCHQKTHRGSDNTPSILDLAGLDSVTLSIKLKGIQDSSSDHIHFDSISYSPDVRDSVFNYIKKILDPEY